MKTTIIFATAALALFAIGEASARGGHGGGRHSRASHSTHHSSTGQAYKRTRSASHVHLHFRAPRTRSAASSVGAGIRTGSMATSYTRDDTAQITRRAHSSGINAPCFGADGKAINLAAMLAPVKCWPTAAGDGHPVKQ